MVEARNKLFESFFILNVSKEVVGLLAESLHDQVKTVSWSLFFVRDAEYLNGRIQIIEVGKLDVHIL